MYWSTGHVVFRIRFGIGESSVASAAAGPANAVAAIAPATTVVAARRTERAGTLRGPLGAFTGVSSRSNGLAVSHRQPGRNIIGAPRQPMSGPASDRGSRY